MNIFEMLKKDVDIFSTNDDIRKKDIDIFPTNDDLFFSVYAMRENRAGEKVPAATIEEVGKL